MNKRSLLIFLNCIFCIIGLGLSIYLTIHYYGLRTGLGSFYAVCNIAEQFNCDKVSLSSYSNLFGIPLSSIAGISFLILFFFNIIGWIWQKSHFLFLHLIASLAMVLTGLVYFFLMAFVIRSYCFFCILLDFVNILLLAQGIILFYQMRESFKFQVRQLLAPFLTTCIVGTAGLFFFSRLNALPTQQEAIAFADQILAQPVQHVDIFPTDAVFGAIDAPITIVEFADFECPFCKLAATQLHSLLYKYPNIIRVVFKHFPLNPHCNPLMKMPGHPSACFASKTFLCFQEKGYAKEAYEALFENQQNFFPYNFLSSLYSKLPISLSQVLSLEALEKCINDSQKMDHILKNIEQAEQLKVFEIPAFFINGHLHKGLIPFNAWEVMIQRLLKS